MIRCTGIRRRPMDEIRQELAFFKETGPQTRVHRSYFYALRRLWANLVVESDRLVRLVWNLGGPIVKLRSLEMRRTGPHDYPKCVERIQRETRDWNSGGNVSPNCDGSAPPPRRRACSGQGTTTRRSSMILITYLTTICQMRKIL